MATKFLLLSHNLAIDKKSCLQLKPIISEMMFQSFLATAQSKNKQERSSSFCLLLKLSLAKTLFLESNQRKKLNSVGRGGGIF